MANATGQSALSSEKKWVLEAIRQMRKDGENALGTGTVPNWKRKDIGFTMYELFSAEFEGQALQPVLNEMFYEGLIELAPRKGGMVLLIEAELRAIRAVQAEKTASVLAAIRAKIA